MVVGPDGETGRSDGMSMTRSGTSFGSAEEQRDTVPGTSGDGEAVEEANDEDAAASGDTAAAGQAAAAAGNITR